MSGAGGKPATMLVGRGDELAEVEDLIAASRSRTGGALLLEGDGGLGKTSVLAAAARLAADAGLQVLRARGLAGEREFPFSVVHQILDRTVAGVGGRDHSVLLDGAAGLAVGVLTGGPAADLPAVLHGLYWLVVNLSEHDPVLLCVDDADAADESSLRFLAYLAPRLDGLGVGMLLAARPAAPGEEPSLTAVRAALADSTQTLRPLTVVQVADLVIGCAPAADADFARACAEVTGGNPFYIQEVLRAVRTHELDAASGDSTRLRDIGADAIHRAALVRMARTGPDAIRLARALAILVDGAPLRRAATLAGLDAAAAAHAADTLAARGIVTIQDGRLAFVHALVRQSVYTDLPEGRRALEHGRAARMLAAEDAGDDLITTHLLRALPHGDPWTVQMLRAAAVRALALGSPEAAVRQLRRALDEPPNPAERPRLLLDLGRAETAAGHPQAVTHLTQAIDLLADRDLRSSARRSLASALAARGQRRAAAEVLEQLLGELPVDTEAHGQALADFLVDAMFEPEARQRAVARIEALRRRPPAGRSVAERRLLAILSVRSGQRADPADDTVALVRGAWQDGQLLTDEGPGGSGWLMAVWGAELAERTDVTLSITGAVLAAAQRSGSVDAFATASYFQAVARRRRGQLLDAQADLEQALRSESSGWRRYSAACRVELATLLVERGQLSDARAVLAALERTADPATARTPPRDGSDREPASPTSQGMLESAWRLHATGLLALAERRPEDALRQLRLVGGMLRTNLDVEHTILPWRTDAALAAIACGRPDLAAEVVAPIHRRAEAAGLLLSLARCLRVRGLLAVGDDQLDLLRRAAHTAHAAGDPVAEAAALADLGAALRRAGDRLDCRAPLQEAVALATACGAQPVAHRASQDLAAAGARPRRTSQTGRDALTPSELRVGEMAASAMTNKQIAQALFVTEKTVEYHLRHVFDKLGVTRRAELARHLAAVTEPAAGAG